MDQVGDTCLTKLDTWVQLDVLNVSSFARQKTIFFKEHSKNDLFDYDSPEATGEEGGEPPLEIADPYKLKLLAVSNTYGYLAAAFNDSESLTIDFVRWPLDRVSLAAGSF